MNHYLKCLKFLLNQKYLYQKYQKSPKLLLYLKFLLNQKYLYQKYQKSPKLLLYLKCLKSLNPHHLRYCLRELQYQHWF
jgi:hypothetical protein